MNLRDIGKNLKIKDLRRGSFLLRNKNMLLADISTSNMHWWIKIWGKIRERESSSKTRLWQVHAHSIDKIGMDRRMPIQQSLQPMLVLGSLILRVMFLLNHWLLSDTINWYQKWKKTKTRELLLLNTVGPLLNVSSRNLNTALGNSRAPNGQISPSLHFCPPIPLYYLLYTFCGPATQLMTFC